MTLALTLVLRSVKGHCVKGSAYIRKKHIYLYFDNQQKTETSETNHIMHSDHYKRPSSYTLYRHNSCLITECYGNHGLKTPCLAFFKMLCILWSFVYIRIIPEI